MTSLLRSRKRHVLAGAALVAALALTLVLRASSRPGAPATEDPATAPRATASAPGSSSRPDAPAATVPEPRPMTLADLAAPCWSCRAALEWPLRSRFDLDHLAPLGSGAGNAAVWLRQFAKESGDRAGEVKSIEARMVDGPAELGRVLPGDDPFLLEAGPWADQGTMRFYPGIFPIEGARTEIPNLIIALELARSWVARGRLSTDPAAALADYRRAMRWGRLLRQEDATIIADLVGMASIRIAAEAMLEHGRDHGDLKLALAAAIALGEIAPQRLLTSERITRVAIHPVSTKPGSLDLPAERFDAIERLALHAAERRFRGEALIDLGIVYQLGSGEQRQRAGELLERVAAETDPIVAAHARWALDHPVSEEMLEMMGG